MKMLLRINALSTVVYVLVFQGFCVLICFTPKHANMPLN